MSTKKYVAYVEETEDGRTITAKVTDQPSTKKELMNKLKAERLQVKETRKVLNEKQDEDRSKRFKRGASNPIRL